MTQFVLRPPQVPSVAIAHSEQRFAIRRVYCVGRNFAAHAREMGNDAEREPPFFFSKPADAVVAAEGVVPYPPLTSDFHHEVEMVVAIGQGGSDIAVEDALSKVWGYGVGVDLTRRDVQDVAKKLSRPWDLSKGFDASAPCTALHPVQSVGHPKQGEIWLSINGVRKQTGDLQDMIWPVSDIIHFLSMSVALAPGDLIYCGTPSGVGPIGSGDTVSGGVEGLGTFSFVVAGASVK